VEQLAQGITNPVPTNGARTGGCGHQQGMENLIGLMQMVSDKVSKTTVLAFSVEEPHHGSG
jgi:hypothetical protein